MLGWRCRDGFGGGKDGRGGVKVGEFKRKEIRVLVG